MCNCLAVGKRIFWW